MKPLSEATICVVDSGLFLPMALRLAEDAKRVIYWSPEMRPTPSVKQAYIGKGFENIERVKSFWPHIEEVDCFAFPDVNQGELQLYLESTGKPVWGSRSVEMLELDREFFMEKLEELGLDVPEHYIAHGWTELCDMLKDYEDVYIKISEYRGDFETKHWRSWERDSDWLYKMAIVFGPLREHIDFMICPKIETNLEIGGDVYSVDGGFPSLMLHGIEGKDKCYFSAVTKREDMPEDLQEIMQAFSPMMKEGRYRNQWSMEVRINDDGKFFIDDTRRGGMPSSGSQQLLWSNFPEIVYAGAHGELVDPEPNGMYSIECMITAKGDPELWQDVEIEDDLLPWVRFSGCCFVDGRYAFPPPEHPEAGSRDLGWLVAIGDTPRETLERQKELAKMLPPGLSADVESLVEVIEEIETEEAQGIEFSKKEMPKPSEAIT